MKAADNIINGIAPISSNKSARSCVKFKLAHYLLSDIGKEYGEARLELRDRLRNNRTKGAKRAELYAPIKAWVISRAKQLHKNKPSISKAAIAQKIWEELYEEKNKELLGGVAPPNITTIKRYWLPKGKADAWQ